MIVRFWKPGRSFKWCGIYLTHDPKAQTAERIAWTHTLNLAHDDVPSAVHEMLNTFRDRDLLKEQAGIRRGGSSAEKPVKHFSLNWHPDETPSKVHMIETVQSFLQSMGWHEHQCALVAHSDKKHHHVHVMLNAIHPERGTRLNDSFEHVRAQEWALGYEQEHGIRCEQRLKPAREREKSPPRPAWEQLQSLRSAFETEAESSRDDTAMPGLNRAAEWQRLKTNQKRQRLAFQAERRDACRQVSKTIYREVREIYRSEWRTYYGLKQAGASAETLSSLRAGIVARQNETFQTVCEPVAAGLRTKHAATYRILLDQQQQDRATLTARQDRGLPSQHLLTHHTPTIQATTPAKDALGRANDAAHVTPSPRADLQTRITWTHRAGLAPQQRSVARWLDRAAHRIGTSPEAAAPSTRNRLREAADDLRQHARSRLKGNTRVGIEPDG